MYTVSVAVKFLAAHGVKLPDGSVEEPHVHDWTVRVYYSSSELNELGMVVDFHDAERDLSTITTALHNQNLNTMEAFATQYPTAEAIARYIHDKLPTCGRASVSRVEVTEAPGCIASFEPEKTAKLQAPAPN